MNIEYALREIEIEIGIEIQQEEEEVKIKINHTLEISWKNPRTKKINPNINLSFHLSSTQPVLPVPRFKKSALFLCLAFHIAVDKFLNSFLFLSSSLNVPEGSAK